MDINSFFQQLWDDYRTITPQAERIHALFSAYGPVRNDHVAFRTLRYGPYGISELEPRLLSLGYVRDQNYHFPEKKLEAWSYTHRDAEQPLIFLSELLLDQLPANARDALLAAVHTGEEALPPGAEAFMAGRCWAPPPFDVYQALAKESEYAAWLLAWGFRANHFTVSINHLPRFASLQEVTEFLINEGFVLNTSGGVIKGSPDVLLEQASTLADIYTAEFANGERHGIPSCYYEFALRYPDKAGNLYQGFVAASADKIFESTHRGR